MEQERKKRLSEAYEKVLAREVEAMAREEGLLTQAVTATIDKSDASPSYGQVETVSVKLKRKEKATQQAMDAAVGASPIASVHVGAVTIEDSNPAPKRAEPDEPKVEAWRRKVAERYGLEATDIRVEWTDE